MDARQLLLDQHALIHCDAVAVAQGKPIADHVWSRVTETQMREVAPGHSSLVWLLWHMTRSEDVGVNALIRGEAQVLDRGSWVQRLGLSVRDVGTAMSDDEAASLSQTVDLTVLREYRDAVGRETRAWLAVADLDALDGESEAVARLVPSGMFQPRILPVLEPVFAGKSGAWVINRLGIWHNFYHLGEAFHVMQVLGVQTHG